MRSRGVCLAPFDSVCSAQTPPRSARVAARSESSPLSRPRGVPPCTRLPVRPAAAGRPGRGHGSAPVSDAAVNPGRVRLSKSAFSFSRREQAEVEWRAPRRSRRGRADPRAHPQARGPSPALTCGPRGLFGVLPSHGSLAAPARSRSDLRTWLAPCTFGCARVTSSL